MPERIAFEDVITYPANRQDIAIVVAEESRLAHLVGAALDAGGSELREARVFDVYRGEQVGAGREVGGVHLVFQSPSETFPDGEPNELRHASSQRSTSALGAGCEARSC